MYGSGLYYERQNPATGSKVFKSHLQWPQTLQCFRFECIDQNTKESVASNATTKCLYNGTILCKAATCSPGSPGLAICIHHPV